MRPMRGDRLSYGLPSTVKCTAEAGLLGLRGMSTSSSSDASVFFDNSTDCRRCPALGSSTPDIGQTGADLFIRKYGCCIHEPSLTCDFPVLQCCKELCSRCQLFERASKCRISRQTLL